MERRTAVAGQPSPSDGFAIHLAARPGGWLEAEHLAVVDRPVPRLAPGSVLVRNFIFAIDPAPVAEVTTRWPLHAAVPAGPLVGRVVASRSADLPSGTLISHNDGWATHSVLPGGDRRTRVLRPPGGVPPAAYLSVLGLPGLAAYVGLTRILRLRAGESLFVADAGDPVSRATARVARLLGATTIVGAASIAPGSGAVIDDACFDVMLEPGDGWNLEIDRLGLRARLDAALIGAGSFHLPGALSLVRELGRVAWLHGEPQLAAAAVPASGLAAIHERSIRLEGFGLRHHLNLLPRVEALLTGELLAGRLNPGQTTQVSFRALPAMLAQAARWGCWRADSYHVAD